MFINVLVRVRKKFLGICAKMWPSGPFTFVWNISCHSEVFHGINGIWNRVMLLITRVQKQLSRHLNRDGGETSMEPMIWHFYCSCLKACRMSPPQANLCNCRKNFEVNPTSFVIVGYDRVLTYTLSYPVIKLYRFKLNLHCKICYIVSLGAVYKHNVKWIVPTPAGSQYMGWDPTGTLLASCNAIGTSPAFITADNIFLHHFLSTLCRSAREKKLEQNKYVTFFSFFKAPPLLLVRPRSYAVNYSLPLLSLCSLQLVASID